MIYTTRVNGGQVNDGERMSIKKTNDCRVHGTNLVKGGYGNWNVETCSL